MYRNIITGAQLACNILIINYPSHLLHGLLYSEDYDICADALNDYKHSNHKDPPEVVLRQVTTVDEVYLEGGRGGRGEGGEEGGREGACIGTSLEL